MDTTTTQLTNAQIAAAFLTSLRGKGVLLSTPVDVFHDVRGIAFMGDQRGLFVTKNDDTAFLEFDRTLKHFAPSEELKWLELVPQTDLLDALNATHPNMQALEQFLQDFRASSGTLFVPFYENQDVYYVKIEFASTDGVRTAILSLHSNDAATHPDTSAAEYSYGQFRNHRGSALSLLWNIPAHVFALAIEEAKFTYQLPR